ncbi:MAG: tetratricopeptide repeat-containing sensor histidine kinase [Chitinophagaceae bacterium]
MKIHCLPVIILITSCISGRVAAQSPYLDSLFNKGKLYITRGHFDSAISIFENCFILAEKQNDSLKAGNALIGIGISYDEGGKFEIALQYYFKALSIYEKINNQIKIGGTLKNIGNIYRVLKNYPSARLFLERALAVQIVQKDSASIARVLNDMGLMYMDQHDYVKASYYFNSIIHHYKNNISEESEAYVFNNVGIIHAESGNFASSFSSYLKSGELMKKMGDKYGQALVFSNTGDAFYKLGDFRKALDFHLKNLSIAREIKSGELLLGSYNNLSKTYVALADFKSAYWYSEQRQSLKDSVFEGQRMKNYAEMETKYLNEKKQIEILLLRQQNKIASIEIVSQHRLKYLLIAIAALVFIIAAVLFKNYKAGRKTNRLLSSFNDKLSQANQTKVKLISILTHDLRSPVSSLFHFLQLEKKKSTFLSPDEKEQLSDKIAQASDHLLETMEDLLFWSKSQMEHFLPVQEEMKTADLVDDIIHLYEPFASNKGVCITKKVHGELKLFTDPNFIRIVLRNLLGNAIKFTPSGGEITVSVKKEVSAITFSVRDNGPGITSADLHQIFDWNSIRSDSSGLGLKLAREFTEKLGGRLEVFSEVGQGTEFMIVLPQPAY